MENKNSGSVTADGAAAFVVIVFALSFKIPSVAAWPATAQSATCRFDEFGPPNFDGPYKSIYGWDLQDESMATRRISAGSVLANPTPCCLESEKETHTGRFADYATGLVGGYRMKESTFANEGRSFCLIGEHIAGTALKYSPQLRGFAKLFNPKIGASSEPAADGPLLPLGPDGIESIALLNLSSNGFLDIGSHINPDDLNQMNYFDLSSSVQPTKPPLTKDSVLKTNRSYEDYKRAGCRWTGKLGERLDGHVYWSRPAVTEHQPHFSCVNPYEVEISEIHAHGIRLHNYLHVTVVANHISAPDHTKNCPTGKAKWLILEARDQRGLPVGHFTTDVPCDSLKEEPHSGPGGIKGIPIYGTQDNILPCMYAPRDAVSHPGVFVVALPAEGEYFTAAHATWRFAQMTSDFISEIHFVALVVESAKPLRYFTSRKENFHAKSRCGWAWECPDHKVPFPGQDKVWTSQNCRNKHPAEPDFEDFAALKWHWKDHTFWNGPYWRQSGETQEWMSWKPAEVWNDLYQLYGFQQPLFSYADEGYRKGRFSTNPDWDKYSVCALSDESNRRPYGYTARKRVLYPQMSTLGGWDYASPFWVPNYVDCHQAMNENFFKLSQHKNLSNPSWMYRDREGSQAPGKLNVPNNIDTYDVDAEFGENRTAVDPREPTKKPVMVYINEKWTRWGNYDELPSGWNKPPTPYPPLPWQHVFRWWQKDRVKLTTLYAEDDEMKTYFGTRGTFKAYDEPLRGESLARAEEIGAEIKKLKFSSMASMGQPERCPCPALPTLPPPEDRTKPPLELEGRRLHATQMLVAWVVLIPIALFSSRYYKETYSRVFFLQEFWWLTIHVLTLFTALLFIAGGIYVARLNRETERFESSAIDLHVGLGWTAIALFLLQIISGPFRALKPAARVMQITFHWLFGILEYLIGVTVIFMAGAIKQGFLNCTAFSTFITFITVQLIFHFVMDISLRLSDRAMRLRPRRTYLPPPVMRLFHSNAPFAKFRMVMLLIYYLTCIGFYVSLQGVINSEGGEESCYVPDRNDTDFIET